MMLLASKRLAGSGVTFEQLSQAEQFGERHREINRELTTWIKRVRHESGSNIRYMLTAEAHKSGLPHYHMLLHEGGEDQPVRASTIKGQWKLGFSQCKLVAQDQEKRAAAYVSKYLSKDARSRVRASVGYGHTAHHTPSGIVPSSINQNIEQNVIPISSKEIEFPKKGRTIPMEMYEKTPPDPLT
jgi:hypothetical protein